MQRMQKKYRILNLFPIILLNLINCHSKWIRYSMLVFAKNIFIPQYGWERNFKLLSNMYYIYIYIYIYKIINKKWLEYQFSTACQGKSIWKLFNRLPHSLIRVKKYIFSKIEKRKIHHDWVLKVKYFPELRCFASCSPHSKQSFVLEEIDRLYDDG